MSIFQSSGKLADLAKEFGQLLWFFRFLCKGSVISKCDWQSELIEPGGPQIKVRGDPIVDFTASFLASVQLLPYIPQVDRVDYRALDPLQAQTARSVISSWNLQHDSPSCMSLKIASIIALDVAITIISDSSVLN